MRKLDPRRMAQPTGALAEILSRDVDPDRPFGGYVGDLSIPAASEPAPPPPEPLRIEPCFASAD